MRELTSTKFLHYEIGAWVYVIENIFGNISIALKQIETIRYYCHSEYGTVSYNFTNQESADTINVFPSEESCLAALKEWGYRSCNKVLDSSGKDPCKSGFERQWSSTVVGTTRKKSGFNTISPFWTSHFKKSY